jgi:hypothetical protein
MTTKPSCEARLSGRARALDSSRCAVPEGRDKAPFMHDRNGWGMRGYAAGKLERSLACLAKIADIAKDPLTPEWYRRNLRALVKGVAQDALTVFFWLHQRIDDSNAGQAALIAEEGTSGLVEALEAANVKHFLTVSRDTFKDEDDSDRAVTYLDPPREPVQKPWQDWRRSAALRIGLMHLDNPKRPLDQLRVLAKLMHSLVASEYVDTAFIQRQYTQVDMGLTESEVLAVLDELAAKDIVYVDNHLTTEERLAVRILSGENSPRNEPPVH